MEQTQIAEQAQTTQLVTIEGLGKEDVYLELEDRYQLSRSGLLKRLGRLGIRLKKDKEKAWIAPEDLEKLDQLHTHRENGGSIDSFLNPPSEEELAIAHGSNQQIKKYSTPLTHNPVNVYTADGSINQMAQLMNIAQERAAGILIAERALTSQYLTSPELLPDRLLDLISQYEEKCVPAQVKAEDFARQLLSDYEPE
jgi:hypothetical protein